MIPQSAIDAAHAVMSERVRAAMWATTPAEAREYPTTLTALFALGLAEIEKHMQPVSGATEPVFDDESNYRGSRRVSAFRWR